MRLLPNDFVLTLSQKIIEDYLTSNRESNETTDSGLINEGLVLDDEDIESFCSYVALHFLVCSSISNNGFPFDFAEILRAQQVTTVRDLCGLQQSDIDEYGSPSFSAYHVG